MERLVHWNEDGMEAFHKYRSDNWFAAKMTECTLQMESSFPIQVNGHSTGSQTTSDPIKPIPSLNHSSEPNNTQV